MGGSSGGGSSRTPVEAKETGRSYQVARILEVISEGEIYGLVDDMRSVYLDNTPLCNEDGSFNFKNIEIYANQGIQNQQPLPNFDVVEREMNVSQTVRKDKPLIRTVTDKEVTRLRVTLGVERLMQSTNDGDINETSVALSVDILKNNRIHQTYTHTFSGKYSSAYREAFYISDLPSAPFQIRVTRVTEDSQSSKLQNETFFASYTEIIDEKFAYPNTALVGIKIDSDYFSQIPKRNYEIYGIIVKVPSNYDSWNKRYTTSIWDGTFKLDWTNNPAWIAYDLITNPRYGMGKRLGEFGIDKWQLYAIGRYCDEIVKDGYGGYEPRMTCNIWITDQRKAYELLNDLFSVFRGMPVWNGQALTAVQDRASDPVWTYTNANTVGGFTRTRTARKARHNSIQVEYIDASDSYEKKIETVKDDALIQRFGLNVKKVTAFGCTSRGQAYRTGKWILETERLETETITFTVGQEGLMHLPYDIIEVADNEYAGTNIGGRIVSAKGRNVVLDRPIEIDDNSYLSFISSLAVVRHVKIHSFDKNTNTVTLADDAYHAHADKMQWTLSTKKVVTGLYRAITIKENSSSEGKTYTITALQHVPEKEDIVTNGTYFEPRRQSIHSAITDAEVKYDGKRLVVSGISTQNTDSKVSIVVSSYTVKLTRNGALIYIKTGLPSPDIELDDLENGDYEAVIMSYNEHNQLLHTFTRTFTINRPPIVKEVEIYTTLRGIALRWAYVDDVTETEIFVNTEDNLETATKLVRMLGVSYTHELGAKETRYYWLRHVRGRNIGKFDQVQGRKGVSAIDLDERLKEANKALKENVVDEIFDVALPARQLEMVKVVNSIPNEYIYQEASILHNIADGKLYRWNGTKYISAVAASDIVGTLSDRQIQALSVSKLTGAVPKAKIAQEFINEVNLASANIANLERNLAGKANASALTDYYTKADADSAIAAQVDSLKSSFVTDLNKKKNADHYVKLDLTKLHHNKWYPVTFSSLQPSERFSILVRQDLGSKGHFPSWATHNTKSFALSAAWTTNGFGWGTMPVIDRQIETFEYNWTKDKVSPLINIGQLTNSSIEFCYLRGGAYYDVYTSRNVAIAVQTTTFTASGQSVSVLDAYDAKLVPISNIKKITVDINDERIARTTANNAFAQQITVLTSDVGTAKGTAEATARTVADVKKGVESAYTIKTEAMSGNRVAMAGLMLGATANARTVESSVVVLADRFEVASNKNGAIKKMFQVSSNQVYLSGNMIIDGGITSSHISTGAIKANHVAAGEISAEKLAIGLGGNLVYNPIFANIGTNGLPDGWDYYSGDSTGSTSKNTDINYGLRSFALPDENCLRFERTTQNTTSYRYVYQKIAVAPNQWYVASAYIGNHRSADCRIEIDFHDKDDRYLSFVHKSGGNAFTNLTTADRVFVKFKTPSNCERIKFILRHTGIVAGQKTSIMLVARPQLEECTEHTKAPSAWKNAGVTSIHGGSIKTRTITAQQIQANAITANEIAANSIYARHITAYEITSEKIASNTIKAAHIASHQITADKLSVNELSAITSNIGTVNAGVINGITINSTNINGSVIKGTEIEGGVIRGARFIGATGDFTGTLQVSSTVGALVQQFEQMTNFTKISQVMYDREDCYTDYNNTNRRICNGADLDTYTYRSDLTFTIGAHPEETIITPPSKGTVISFTPTANGLLGSDSKVLRSNTEYKIVVRNEFSKVASWSRPPKIDNFKVTLTRNKRF